MKNGVITDSQPAESNRLFPSLVLSTATAIVYFFSNPKPQSYYDYTFRVAGNLLRGAIGFSDKPPSWLNEFVPFEGEWYSVFPLGAVVTMIPVAFFNVIGVITEMPGALIAAILAGCLCFLLLKIASKYELPQAKQILLTMAILFGTFTWTNLTFAGAWQLALGFAMVGELGAIYFTVYDRRPLIAGIFFALAFGNRTENLLTAPVFIYLLSRVPAEANAVTAEINKDKRQKSKIRDRKPHFKIQIPNIIKFCAFPLALGVATLIYNY